MTTPWSFEFLRSQIVGIDSAFDTPFGRRLIRAFFKLRYQRYGFPEQELEALAAYTVRDTQPHPCMHVALADRHNSLLSTSKQPLPAPFGVPCSWRVWCLFAKGLVVYRPLPVPAGPCPPPPPPILPPTTAVPQLGPAWCG